MTSTQHDAPETIAVVLGFMNSRIDPAVAVDDDLFALGYVTSLFAAELVAFVERQFALELPNCELTIDNFRSAGAVAAVIERLRST